jgi:transcriptional regulator with XRE-family HTH domain
MEASTYELLRIRQKSMQMPYEVIAQKADIGIATVKRFFSGGNSSISIVERIASVLGSSISISYQNSAEKLLEMQIEKKALLVVNRVMKTSALEQQKPNNMAYDKMLEKAKIHISKMPKSQIWA